MQEEFEQVKVGDKVTMNGANKKYFTDGKEYKVLTVDTDETTFRITDGENCCWLGDSKKYLRKVEPKFKVEQV